MTFQAVVCDLDGVLLNSKTVVFECYRRAFAERGERLTLETFNQALWGKTFPTKATFLSPDAIGAIRARKNELFADEAAKGIPVSAIMPQMLLNCFPYLGVYICTAGSEAATRAKMKCLPRFLCDLPEDRLLFMADKHDPHYWQQLSNATGADPKDTLVFDDDADVIRVAKWCGFTAIRWTEFDDA